MSRPKKLSEPIKTPTRPATTPEGRENQLISLAYDLAEQRVRDGSASNTLLVHLMKRGTAKERVEQEILEKQRELIVAKTEALQSQKRIEELYGEAMKAFTRYNGQDEDEDYEIVV